MPSKEARAYNGVLRIAFKHLVGELALSLNQCIASDVEETMYGPVRGMIHNIRCFNKVHHQLDTFDLLTNGWEDNLANKITNDELKKSLIYCYRCWVIYSTMLKQKMR